MPQNHYLPLCHTLVTLQPFSSLNQYIIYVFIQVKKIYIQDLFKVRCYKIKFTIVNSNIYIIKIHTKKKIILYKKKLTVYLNNVNRFILRFIKYIYSNKDRKNFYIFSPFSFFFKYIVIYKLIPKYYMVTLTPFRSNFLFT